MTTEQLNAVQAGEQVNETDMHRLKRVMLEGRCLTIEQQVAILMAARYVRKLKRTPKGFGWYWKNQLNKMTDDK